MIETRIKISTIVANQLPAFVREEFPLVSEFLSQYYLSLEGQGSTLDILQNIDQYVKVDNLTNIVDSTTLGADVSFIDDVITVQSTYGFPKSYGLIQIGSEIITYTGITATTFTGCIRGFSGVTSYQSSNAPDELTFKESEIAEHTSGSTVTNLSVLFLKEFFHKVKRQIVPGFEDRELYSGIDQRIFIKQSNDFYTSKGTDQSFEILFRALYGEDVEVIKPRDYLLTPSNAEYRVSRDLVVEALEGNPEDLLNRTLFQDETDEFPGASGSINNVQRIERDNKTYYVISLDYDYDRDISVAGSIFGEFSVHPTTKVVTSVSSGSTVLDVDSTVGFPSSGTLIVEYSDGSSITIEYTSKSLTQFYGCSGITRDIDSEQVLRVDAFAYGYLGFNTDETVKVRITGVISDIDVYEYTYYYEPGDIIENKHPGIGLTSVIGNNWFFNIATSYDISAITVQDLVNFKYKVTTFDEHGFSIGDNANLIKTDGTSVKTEIVSILNPYSFIIANQGQIQTQNVIRIQRLVSKVESNNYPGADIYSTNVQNVYSDRESVYVASPSIPNYLNEPLTVNNRSVKFSGTVSGEELTVTNHGFYTGDSVTYRPISSTNTLNISEGIYFVERVNEDTIKLSRSRANINNRLYLTLEGTVTDNIFEYTDLAYQELEPQKIIRKISDPVTDTNDHTTVPGTTGILVNGVEILNYKSSDAVFYGPIQTVDVTNGGEKYDVINPPVLQANGSVGTGLSAYCEVEGSLERIEVIDGGFDYVETPVVNITGGNGGGAVARPVLKTVTHSVDFNSTVSGSSVNLTNDTIAFSSYHKFRDGELIIYQTNGQTSVGGMTTGAQYYVSVQDEYTVKVHKTYTDAIDVTNAVNLTSYGVGNHTFRCANSKKIISAISVVSSGNGYSNRKTTTTSAGINTSLNTITLKSHGYRSGELISYTSGTTAIGGLSNENYYVTKVDDNTIRLSQVGVGSTAANFYFANDQYVELTSTGSGVQSFNYPPISVSVKGKIGVSTVAGQNFGAQLQPVFRGAIKSVYVEDGGVGYGSSEILNYNKQPEFTLNSGSGAQLKAIVSNGKITQVLVLNTGSGYNSPPDIEVNGSGNGAILVPVISSGTITEVKVISGGFNYLEKDTTITVIGSGKNAAFASTPKVWNINIFERILNNNQISDDDGVIVDGNNSSYGLQYSHLYSPRKLRRTILGSKVVNGSLSFVPDLQVQNGREILSNTHSPIIGWAYDGNPIYGPYGYTLRTGGSPRLLKSGYILSLDSDRPNPLDSSGNAIYPDGFFINDYVYDGSGDLDEHNGRFCKTPEFPNGVYAYFTTINTNSVESGGAFKNYRKPEFPYFIGDKFKSTPISYNFESGSNQDDIDLNDTTLSRNITPYGPLNPNTKYDFILDSNQIQKQNTLVKSVSRGTIQGIGINSGGINYKVGDRLEFDNEGTKGFGASAVVSSVLGKQIYSVDISKTEIPSVEFYPYGGIDYLVGFATSPHDLKTRDIITLSGISTTDNLTNKFFTVGIGTAGFTLSSDVDTSSVTGIITYFNVSGNLSFPNIRENDILGIGTEKIRVLNVDTVSSRLRVERAYDGTYGIAHTGSSIINENPRKFIIDGRNLDISQVYDYSRELHFKPSETVGLGTTGGVGITSTLSFANPGAGITQISVPTKSLYIPSHRLTTGDELIYFNYGGDSIGVSTDGIETFAFENGQTLYAARISDDLVGIATTKVGLGSTGSFVGINSSVFVDTLYFVGVGTGENHSLKTVPANILSGTVNRNSATVSTSSTHGLQYQDAVSLNVFAGISTTLSVRYNDYHRKLVIDSRDFVSGDVDIIDNSITLLNHNLTTGQKVIHTATTPAAGLIDNEIYYVYVVSKDKVKLCQTVTDSLEQNPKVVDITGTSSGTISQVNPPLILERNKTLIFDLSHSSLSFTNNSIAYSAFDFGIFSDKGLKNQFYSSTDTKDFEVIKSGTVGIDTNAKLTIKASDSLPETLYYGAVPINLELNNNSKKGIKSDTQNVKNNNELILTNSVLTSTFTVSGIGSTTFSFSILGSPSEDQYLPADGNLFYTTDSQYAYGPIAEVELKSNGRNYEILPSVSRVISGTGTDAVLYPQSSTIGKVISLDIQDIGFDYSADKTLRPEVQLPQILSIDPYSKFDTIGISSIGVNYSLAPDLVVVDGLSKKVITDIELDYELGDSFVTIVKNTSSLNEVTPTIIPINNTNGVSITNVQFNTTSKDVTVSLGSSYSALADFPFAVGDSVLIENVSVGIGSTAKGYNSSRYNYSLFTLTQTDPNIGGANASVTYNLTEYLASGEYPGTFDSINSVGRVIPSKHFPIFDISLEQNKFYKGEIVSSPSASGVVNSWNEKTGNLKVSTIQKFNIGENITASSSKSIGRITAISLFNSFYNIGSSSVVKKGWQTESGFLNSSLQRLHDNDYYQYFSYAIKSKVEYEDWNNAVSSLNHAAGFKKFSDLIVESEDTTAGISTDQNLGTFDAISDLVSEIDLNCVNDFDLARELTVNIDSEIASNEIVFNSRTLQDYLESVGNRVLSIDDISTQFNSNPRPERYNSIDLFLLDDARSKKYIVFIKDKRYTDERQINLVSILHDNSNGFLNQYGRVETVGDLGSFDFNIVGTEGQLLYYPTKYALNDYNLSYVAYRIEDSIAGTDSRDFGDTAKVYSTTQTLASGTSTASTIVSIASTYRSSKILVQYAAVDNSYFEYDELTVIHDGTNVDLLEYGQLSTDILTPFASSGLGTYSAYISGSNINIDITPNAALGVDYNANTIIISIADTSSVGVGTFGMSDAKLDSTITSIASSTSPVSTKVAEYSSDPYSCAYYVVSVEDTTNSQYQVSEIIVANDSSDVLITEFGNLETGSSIGTFDASASGGNIELTFTPIANADIEVRVFQNALGLIDPKNTNTIIDLNNASVFAGYGDYTGTDADVKRQFNLTHNQLPIFERYFVGSASTVVDVSNNKVFIPNHYFVTGEELTYKHAGAGTTQAITIASTNIPGIGITDKLPSTVYAIKVDEVSIKFAGSAEDALKVVPTELDITSVGIGTSHSLTSKKQNSRVLVSIDNVIQSPVVSTAITTTLSTDLPITDNTLTLSGITSFFGGDLIKINNEIMRVDAVGIGSTNVLRVRRPWMGTGIGTHPSGALVTKIDGDYNIVDNTINFISAPYGPVPLSTTTASPDEVDYTGIATYSTFSGRSFLRSGVPNTDIEPYTNNYVLDDVSSQFTGFTTSFNLTSENSNVTGFSTDNAIILVNQIFQGPERDTFPVRVDGDYTLEESVGITSINFTGSISSTAYDINTANVPLGGVIVSVGSTEGFGYQPLVAAGGTAVVSGLGTISSISIGNSGSGYRAGIQTVVNVGVATSSTGIPNIEFIGTAAISGGHIVSVAITNPGTGYTSTNPPIVIFDDPLSYSNIPLVYSSSSVSGVGTQATADIVVGQGSSVIEFTIRNAGYGYGQGEILTFDIGGTAGIPTDTSLTFDEFQVSIESTYSDSFSGWSIGNLLVLDNIDYLFDGTKTSFPIKINGIQKTIRSAVGSLIDVQETLLVFVNDVLQVPGKGYTFAGGSYITFTEAPKVGDTTKILFYQGTSSVDVIDVDVLETIKKGDTVTLNDDDYFYQEDERLVYTINSTDTIDTNLYNGPGVTANESYERPVKWCRQTEDKFVNGEYVAKDRPIYEPLIYPTSTIIQPVGIGSTIVYVESVKTFFDSEKENYADSDEIALISQDSLVSAAATAIISDFGEVSSISITDGGQGYSTPPQVTVSNPVGLGTTQRAQLTASISINGEVSAVTVVSPGTGYTTSNPPQVLIEHPNVAYEANSSQSYVGDFGSIVGFGTTTIGVQNQIIFDLYIPENSYLRDTTIVSSATTVSGLTYGDYFVIKDSNVGSATTFITSLRNTGEVIGIGTQFVDNVYQVANSLIVETNIVGIGSTYVTRVFANIDQFNSESFSSDAITFDSTTYTFDSTVGSYTVYSGGISTSSYFGSYTWGKITLTSEIQSETFNFYGSQGVGGISTSAIVRRRHPLRYNNYL